MHCKFAIPYIIRCKAAKWGKKNNTDKLNLSGQFVRLVITSSLSANYKIAGQPDGQIQFVRVIFLDLKSPWEELPQEKL